MWIKLTSAAVGRILCGDGGTDKDCGEGGEGNCTGTNICGEGVGMNAAATDGNGDDF